MMNERKHLTQTEVERLIAATKNSRNETRDRALLLLMFRPGLKGCGADGHGLSGLQDQQLADDLMVSVLHRHRLNAEAVTLCHRAHFGRIVIGQHH